MHSRYEKGHRIRDGPETPQEYLRYDCVVDTGRGVGPIDFAPKYGITSDMPHTLNGSVSVLKRTKYGSAPSGSVGSSDASTPATRRLHGRPKARNAPFPPNTRRFPSNRAFAPRYSECAYAPPFLRIRIIIPWRKGKPRKQTANRTGRPAKSRKPKGSQRFVGTQAPCKV